MLPFFSPPRCVAVTRRPRFGQKRLGGRVVWDVLKPRNSQSSFSSSARVNMGGRQREKKKPCFSGNSLFLSGGKHRGRREAASGRPTFPNMALRPTPLWFPVTLPSHGIALHRNQVKRMEKGRNYKKKGKAHRSGRAGGGRRRLFLTSLS